MWYRCVKITPHDGELRSIHQDALNAYCQPLVLKIGERGWFRVQDKKIGRLIWRLHTSVVLAVDNVDDMLIVTTAYTRYEFKEAKDNG